MTGSKKKSGVNKRGVKLAFDRTWNEDGKSAKQARKTAKRRRRETEEKYAERTRKTEASEIL
jgi:hypothetical protein